MKIKNWERFQHYKSGKNAKHPEWIKFYPRKLLDDIEWHALDPLDAKVLVMLWGLASENGGSLPKLDVVAFRLRMPIAQINEVLSRLSHWIEDAPSQVLGMSYPITRLEEEEEREEKKKKKERETRASALPPDWAPDQDCYLYGASMGFTTTTVDDMAESMRLWAQAKGEVKKNWIAAFKGWMRRERGKHGSAPQRGNETVQQAAKRISQEMSNGNGTNGFGSFHNGRGGESGGNLGKRVPALSAPGGSRRLPENFD